MRLLTFSVLRNYKLKSFFFTHPKRLYSGVIQSKLDVKSGDTSLVEISETWKAEEEPDLRAAVLRDMQVFPDFVTEEEEQSMLAELEPYLKRMRYEFDHWDNAIQGYRETEKSKWSPENQIILDRVKALAFAPGSGSGEPLPHAHVLDLAGAGHIKPHIDAVRFCGDVIAGVCLVSGAVMRLAHAQKPHLVLDALLARRALYIMKGCARYSFSHAVLGADESVWKGRKVQRLRRVAVICRSQPHPQNK
ncbi:hypothetical protein K1T71_011562 [Dendrolimus kikuchii]|uniref:Uncharacterized protein n=1 Tax=Dendrolimus kikuchii TaxID=765133 RepID=A0ACC1CP69_9NEOP|nr:hypothetical protein K1T71_011562 [Dendrolimus kikuchii]